MEQEKTPQLPGEEEKYVPRPAWQVWAARLGLVLFVAFLILYYVIYFRGGQ